MSNNRTALITGASAGIGTAFAKEFASHYYNLVLIARREDKLNEIAEQIRDKYRVNVTVLPVDLANLDANDRILASLEEQDIKIDVLVNNAGYGLTGGFLDSSWEEHMAMQQVMLTGYLELCYKLLPGMVARNFGRIINVSSVAGLTPPQAGSLYGAIKSYVIDMSVALNFEYADQGIHCTAVCPGFTYTEFHDVIDVREQVSSFPKIMWQSAEAVAAEGYSAVMAGKVLKVNGLVNRVLVAIVGLLPLPLYYAIGRKTTLFEE